MKNLKWVTLFVVVLGLALLPQRVLAGGATLVSTINGFYDVDAFDTPSLHISNSTSFNFTNVTLTLTGYQGDNNGKVQTISLADITAGSTDILVWNGGLGGGTGLFSNDYDDTDGGHACGFPDAAGNDQNVNLALCGQPGNFFVTFTAMWNGKAIFAQFSPNTNATGTFIGWEGLDQLGFSETSFDSHSNGGPNGVLANIFVGTPPPLNTPEPASLLLLGTGLIGVGFARRFFA